MGKEAGIVLASLLSVVSLYGWGYLLAARFPLQREALAAPFGTAGAALILFGLSALGLAGAWPLYFALLAGGLFFASGARPSLPILAPLLLFVPFALVPQAHPDPLYYHLLFARRIHEHGGLYFDAQHPLLFQAGLWEQLYLWTIAWLAPGAGQELIYQQLAGQLLHLTLGLGGTVLVLRALLHALSLPRPALLAWITAACVWLLPVSFVAKNDWGLLLWLAAGALLLLTTERALLAGAFFGAAVSCKWVGAPGAALVALLIAGARGPRFLLPLAAGALLGAAPVLLRNAWFTHDPFFPLFGRSLLSGTGQLILNEYRQGARDPAAWLSNLGRLVAASPVLLAAFFAGALAPKGRERRMVTAGLVLLFVATLVAAVFLNPVLSWRITSPIPLLWQGLAGYAVLRFCERFRIPAVWAAVGFAVAAAFALYPELPLLRGLAREPAEVIRGFAAGDAMAFVRLEGGLEPAAVGGNAQLYYLSSYPAVTVEESPELDRLAGGSPLGLLASLRERRFRWFVESRSEAPEGRSSWLLSFLADECPRCVAYSGPAGRVLDLRALEQAKLKEPVLPAGGAVVPEQK